MVDAPRRLHMYTWQGAKPFITSNSAQLNFEPHPDWGCAHQYFNPEI